MRRQGRKGKKSLDDKGTSRQDRSNQGQGEGSFFPVSTQDTDRHAPKVILVIHDMCSVLFKLEDFGEVYRMFSHSFEWSLESRKSWSGTREKSLPTAHVFSPLYFPFLPDENFLYSRRLPHIHPSQSSSSPVRYLVFSLSSHLQASFFAFFSLFFPH